MESFINSRMGLTLVSALARVTPPWLGTILARLAARVITARRNSRLVRAVRANQWVLAAGSRSPQALDQDVRAVFQHSARSIYELYHYVQNLSAAGRLFTIEPSFQEILDRPRIHQRGLIVAGLHMSGFDLALQWVCYHGLDPLALTIPNPQGGRGLEFEFRQKTGINLVPGSMEGLRAAIRFLEAGGLVVTGIDRPLADCPRQPHFFGRPASLPTHHIFLALKTGTPVRLVISRRGADGKYHLLASAPIEMDPYPSREEALLRNAEKVLAVAEDFIRQAPQQWLISLPVWPQAIHQTAPIRDPKGL
ncbi:MAG: hypothetical protein MUO62_02960 [Anaerolineales bacterium]|nr:hypothetical protein [Anaerolineales bacterium]